MEIILKIENRAYDWDGKESEYYGTAIMKVLHPLWGIK